MLQREKAKGGWRVGLGPDHERSCLLVFFKLVSTTISSKNYILRHNLGHTHSYETTVTNNTYPYHTQSALLVVYSSFFFPLCWLWYRKLISQPFNASPQTLVSRGMELGLYPKVSRKPLMGFEPRMTGCSFLQGMIPRLQQRVGRLWWE